MGPIRPVKCYLVGIHYLFIIDIFRFNSSLLSTFLNAIVMIDRIVTSYTVNSNNSLSHRQEGLYHSKLQVPRVLACYGETVKAGNACHE